MSYIGDSRRPKGPGILPLQDHDPAMHPEKLDRRTSLIAVRVTGRDATGEGLGHYFVDPATAGDVTGALLWPNATRPIPGWSFAWPAIRSKGGGGDDSEPRPGVGIDVGGLNQSIGFKANLPRGSKGPRPGVGINVPTLNQTTPRDPGAKGPNDSNPPKNPDTPTEGGGSGGCITVEDKDQSVLPLSDRDWLPDTRYQPLHPTLPKTDDEDEWPKFPSGTYGIVLPATNESEQIEYFFPIEPRLIAVNFAGDKDMSSMVCDLDKEATIDPERIARIHSFWWVVKKPNAGPNTLAWNLGSPGCSNEPTGFVMDDVAVATPTGGAGGGDGRPPITTGGHGDPRTATGVSRQGIGEAKSGPGPDQRGGDGASTGSQKILARASKNLGGPFDVGGAKDRHFLGKDADKRLINSLHWTTNTLFRRNDEEDGPLFFEGKWPGASSFPLRAYVHLTWDGNREVWRWYAEVPYYHTNPPPPPPPPPPIRTPVTTPTRTPVTTPTTTPIRTPVTTPTRTPVATGGGGGRPPVETDVGGGRPPVETGGGRPPVATGSGGITGGIIGTGVVGPGAIGGLIGGIIGVGASGPGITDFVDPIQIGPNFFGPPSTFFGSIKGPREPMPRAPGVSGGFTNFVGAIASSTLIARPQDLISGTPDLRFGDGVSNTTLAKANSTTPVTGLIDTFGQQGGTTGQTGKPVQNVKTGGQLDPWVYTERPMDGRSSGIFPAGTANGGWVVFPPEVDMADADTGFAPPNVTKSVTSWIAARGAYFAAGNPSTATGRVSNGFEWGDDGSSNLTFSKVTNFAVVSNVFRLNFTNAVAEFVLGTSTGWGQVGGRQGFTVTSVSSTGLGVEETLHTITALANTLSASGKALRVTAFGTVAANANAKTIRLYFGATLLASNDITTNPSGLDWRIDVTMVRTTSSVQTRCVALMTVGAVTQSVVTTFATDATTVDQTITVRALATVASGDVTAETTYIEAIS